MFQEICKFWTQIPEKMTVFCHCQHHIKIRCMITIFFFTAVHSILFKQQTASFFPVYVQPRTYRGSSGKAQIEGRQVHYSFYAGGSQIQGGDHILPNLKLTANLPLFLEQLANFSQRNDRISETFLKEFPERFDRGIFLHFPFLYQHQQKQLNSLWGMSNLGIFCGRKWTELCKKRINTDNCQPWEEQGDRSWTFSE